MRNREGRRGKFGERILSRRHFNPGALLIILAILVVILGCEGTTLTVTPTPTPTLIPTPTPTPTSIPTPTPTPDLAATPTAVFTPGATTLLGEQVAIEEILSLIPADFNRWFSWT